MSANNIQVALKVRPIKKEIDKTPISVWKIVENSIHYVDGCSEYVFDHIFDQNVNNNEVFDKMAKPIVDSALRGINGTIFAYGQTASGKTYTMLGGENNPGVMVLTAGEIFKEIEEACDREFLLRVAYFQIYNEKIFDLLTKSDQELKIHENSNGDVIVNCKEFIITSQQEMMNYLSSGSKLRRCGETNMNECSSRSHAIFRIIIESREINKTSEDGSFQISVLNLVDLAGSERANQTGATGSRSKEGSHINRSLLFLSCVIKQLSENEDKFINYRDSKLTRILQASLGGNALTAIICTITPTVFEETQCTLRFAMCAKKIKNKPQVNEVITDSAMMKKQEKEISRLKKALEIEKTKNSKLKITELEGQIYKENLKIICSHSALINKNHQRRRTWCPSYYDTNNISKEPNLKMRDNSDAERDGLLRSQIPKYLTPLIGITQYRTDDNHNINNDHNDIDSENIIFPISPNNYITERENLTTPPNVGRLQPAIITPKPTLEEEHKRIEEELESLQEFTNLENKLKVQYDTFDIIQQDLRDAQAKIVKYEQEAINSINLKEQLSKIEANLVDAEDKSKMLQQKIKELEIEKREFISMEFEFQQLKNKSKLRESELLEVIHERELKVLNLENSLKSTKENHNVIAEVPIDCICINHVDLEKILSEKLKLQSELTSLKQDCEFNQLELVKLQSENKKLLDGYVCQQSDFELQKNSLSIKNEIKNHLETVSQDNEAIEIERDQYKEEVIKLQLEYNRICNECEKLRVDCTEIRQMFTKHKSEKNLLTEEIQVLNEKLLNLGESFEKVQQDKIDSNKLLTLELEKCQIENLDWQCKHESTVNEYKKLKSMYDEMQFKVDNALLDKDILESQYNEIIEIQQRLEKKYDDGTNNMNGSIGNNVENHLKIIKTLETFENDKRLLIENKIVFESEKTQLTVELQNLRLELNELKEKHEVLQVDYNKVSDEIMDHIQENENLSNQISMLEKEIKENCKKLNSSYCYNGLNVIHEHSEEELICSLKCEIVTLKSLNETLTEENQVSKVNIDMLNKKLYEHGKAEKELNNLVDSITDLENENTELKMIKDNLSEKLDSNGSFLHERLNYLDEENLRLKCNNEQLLIKINSFEEVLEETKNINDNTNDFQSKLNSKSDEVLQLSQKCECLEQQVKNQMNEISNLKELKATTDQQIIQLNENIEELIIKCKRLESQCNLQLNEYNDLLLKCESEEAKNLELQKAIQKNGSNMAFISQAEEECKGLKTSISTLANRIYNLEHERSELLDQKEKLISKIKNITSEVLEDGKVQKEKVLALEKERDLFLEEKKDHLKNVYSSEEIKNERNQFLEHKRELDEAVAKLESERDQLLNDKKELLLNITIIEALENERDRLLKDKRDLELKVESLNILENERDQLLNEKMKLESNAKIIEVLENERDKLLNDKRDLELKVESMNILENERDQLLNEKMKLQSNAKIIEVLENERDKLLNDKRDLEFKVESMNILENERDQLLNEKMNLQSNAKIIEVLENERDKLLNDKRDLELKVESMNILENERDQLLNEKMKLQSNAKIIEVLENERDKLLNDKRDLELKVESMNILENERDQLLNEKMKLQSNANIIEVLENERDKLLNDKRDLELKVEYMNILENERDQLLNEKMKLQSNAKIIEVLENERDKLLNDKRDLELKVESMNILENERDQLLNEKMKLQSNAKIIEVLENERDKLLNDKRDLELKVESMNILENERDQLLNEKMKLQSNAEIIEVLENERDKLLNDKRDLELKVESMNILENERDQLLNEKMKLQSNAKIIEVLENERDKLLNDKRDLELKVESMNILENERDQLLNEKIKLQSNAEIIEVLENERDKLLNDKRDLELKVESMNMLENERDQLLNEKMKLQSNANIIEVLENERDKLLNDKRDLEWKVESMNILETERDQLLNEKMKLQSNAAFIVELNIERDRLLNDKKELESKLEIMNNLEIEREQILKENQKNLKTLENEKMKNITILQKELNQSRLENQELKRNSLAFEALKTEHNDLLKEYESLQLNMQNTQKEFHKIQTDSRTMNEELKNELNRIEEICNKLVNENKDLVKNIKNMHEKLLHVQQLADLEIEKSTTNNRVMRADLGERIQRFEQERDELDIQNKELIVELERIVVLKKDFEELAEKKLEEKKLENKTLNEQISVLKKSSGTSLEMLKSKNNCLEMQIDQLKKELQSLHNENIKARSLIDCKTAEITKIKTEVESEMRLFHVEKKTLLDNSSATEIKLKDRIQKLETEINTFKVKELANVKTNGFSPKRDPHVDSIHGENYKMKSMTTEAAHKISQKARRLSSHDEGRKSLLWTCTRDAQTMTDPTDSSCNCAALDMKLTELKRKLIIRESQVNTLCLEMKTHPMKAENERLKTLLYNDDEQQKVLRKEIKTLKQIILEKTNENKNCLKCLSKLKRSFVENSSQTDAELMATFEISEAQMMQTDLYKSLMGKKEYLKNICRNRHAKVAELEQKYENLLRTYKVISGKYEDVKVVCLSRAEEIESLKQNLKSLK